MVRFIIRRLLYSLATLAGVLLLTFLLFDLAAGDPAAAILGKNARPAEVESLRRELGADLPLLYGRECATGAFAGGELTGGEVNVPAKFPAENIVAVLTDAGGAVREIPVPDHALNFHYTPAPGEKPAAVRFYRRQDSPWNSRILRSAAELISFQKEFPWVKCFDFGHTLVTREPIREVIGRGMGPSLLLMLPIFCGELLGGVLLGLLSVRYFGRWQDRTILLISIISLSMNYLVAIVFGQWLLGFKLGWFPVWGFDSWRNFVIPIIVGVSCGIGGNIRFFRTVFAEELHREYLRTALAKGISGPAVYTRHLLRNGAVQIITKVSAGLPFLFTGSLLLESFFGIPGLGFAGVEALQNSDIQLLKALVLVSALLYIVINLIADLAYSWADPRIKME